MNSQFHKQIKALLHPYLFILKEGTEIQKDLLDYSLLLLQVDCVDRLNSPKASSNPFLPTISSSLPSETIPMQPPPTATSS